MLNRENCLAGYIAALNSRCEWEPSLQKKLIQDTLGVAIVGKMMNVQGKLFAEVFCFSHVTVPDCEIRRSQLENIHSKVERASPVQIKCLI